jgi:hypothetical protein
VDLEQYAPCYRLLEESRKSWEHFISDKLVYILQPSEITTDRLFGIAKNYGEGAGWIEAHLTFQFKGNTYHFLVIVNVDKVRELPREIGEIDNSNMPIDGNTAVLINIAQQIQSPQKMAFYRRPIDSVIRLKRFDDENCLCGYTQSLAFESVNVGFALNRELGSFGIGQREFCQSPDELIQGRTQTIQKVADHQMQLIGDRFNLISDAVPLVFNVILTENSYGITFPIGANPIPQAIKVFFRPHGLEKGISHGDWHN